MAGIGGIPGAIYLPRDNRFGDLGAAIGGIGGNVLQGYQQSQALQQSQGMPPEQQVQFLMQRLGPQGAKFVENLMNVKRSEADIKHSEAATAEAVQATKNAETLNRLHEDQLAHADEIRRMEMRVQESEIAARRASAAGSYSAAAMHNQELQESRFRLENLRKNEAISDVLRQQILHGMGQDQPGLGNGGLPGDHPSTEPTPPDLLEGKPRVKPQSSTGSPPQAEPIPTSVEGARTSTIAARGETAGEGAPTGGDEPSSVEKTLSLIHAFEKGGDPTQGQAIKPIQLTPDQNNEILAHLGKGDLAGAFKTKNDFQQPTRVDKRDIGGTGFEAEFALFPNGTQQMIPGSLQDKRKPADQQLRQIAGGAVMWSQSNDVLKTLSGAKPGDPEADVMGGMAVRRINELRRRFGLEPVGDENTKDVRNAYAQISQHNIFALRSLLGGRSAQKLVEQLQDMSAKPTDDMPTRNAKFKATEITAETFIKNEVETAIAGKQQVPPPLLQVYEQKGLDRRSMASIQRDYLDAFKALNMKAPPLPFAASETGDVGQRTSAGSKDEPQGGSGGDTVKIGKQTYSRKDAEAAAKAHGITLQDLIDHAE